MADIAPLQPLTLAAFLPWGSSEGAGRVSQCKNKNTSDESNLFTQFYRSYFNPLKNSTKLVRYK